MLLLASGGCASIDPQHSPVVYVAGAMRNVMIQGNLTPTINLDTITNKRHLYGIGPADQLKGEILIDDGVAYRSFVDADSSIQMESTFQLRSPFFVYSNVNKWKEYTLPDSVQTIPQVDAFLSFISRERKQPFAFKLTGTVLAGTFHIVNFPAGEKIKSPGDVNKQQLSVQIEHAQVRLIGFFSTNHKGIFTHHDSNVHIHLITSDGKQMGHLDSVTIGPAKSLRLYVAE